MALDALYQITWGRFTLWCSSVSTENSRSVVVHELADGNVHPLQDRGLAPHRTRCSLLFDWMKGETVSPIQRFREFKQAAVDVGGTALFTHPIDGRFVARVGEFSYDLDEDGNVANCTAEFIKDAELTAVSPAAAGIAGATGAGGVEATAAELAAELEDIGVDSTIPADAVAAQSAWTAGDEQVSTRQILIDAARLSNDIASLIEGEGLEDELEKYEAYHAAIMLGEAIRSAALAATAETSSVFVVRLTRPSSLLALCASFYGGAEAEDRERQVIALNDIRRPGWLDVGVDYLFPTRSVDAKAAF